MIAQGENLEHLMLTTGFSKLTKREKMSYVAQGFSRQEAEMVKTCEDYLHPDPHKQKVFDEISENTISNFYLPFSVAPNFLIDGKLYCVPMTIEESSVVAAAAKSAKYWMQRGGFHTRVESTVKFGHVHFLWRGDERKLQEHFTQLRPELLADVAFLTSNMQKRGGGLLDLELLDLRHLEEDYFQIKGSFDTCDAMGANFINSVLERLAQTFERSLKLAPQFTLEERNVKIIMCILSNYTPQCMVEAYVQCPVSALTDPAGKNCMSAEEFVFKFEKAIRISKIDVYRATTHNKGIFNGIDAVVMATGNDFRAIEANGHAYAARNGRYEGLSDVSVKNGVFTFSLKIPLALGTVGGLTSLHPMVKVSMDLLGGPSADQLMRVAAAVGLAQNFAAIRSLTTTGIQKGHMKMHLVNILNYLEASEEERQLVKSAFENQVVTFTAVRDFVISLRNVH